ncbi:MAG: hypothetical protein R2759_10465 [Bacteroidales bacterium]
MRQEGIIGGKTGFNRTTGRVSHRTNMTDWLKFNSAITYSYIDRKSINDFGWSVLFNAVICQQLDPVYDYNGNYYYAPDDVGIEIINPLQQIADTIMMIITLANLPEIPTWKPVLHNISPTGVLA